MVNLNIYSNNSYYWADKDEPIMLLGGSVEDNLFQIPDIKKQLKTIKDAGGNYVRNTMSCRDEGNVWPFASINGKYDLDTWNQEYWERFKLFLQETAARDIIVQMEIWATFDFYLDWWQENPFNPCNNINFTVHETSLPEVVDSHPIHTDNNFFWSIPEENNNQIVLKYQQKFVDKILSYTLEYDHILYCMDNEISVTPEWGSYWASYIKKRAAEIDKKVYTTEMWDAHDLNDAQHDNTFDHPELYDFVDISQNNHQHGQKHYQNALKQRERISDNPRPMNNVKIYGGEGKHGDVRHGIECFWRSIFAGSASARFHRPNSGIGISKKAQQMIGSARMLLEKFNIFSSKPALELLQENKDNECFLLFDSSNNKSVFYFPRGGSVVFKNKDINNNFSKISWLDINQGIWSKKNKISVKNRIKISTPDTGQWVAVID